MSSHVLRPVFVALGLVIVIFIARSIMVPSDFGVSERGFMYGYHREGNEAEWANFKVKYKSKKYCEDCHVDEVAGNLASPHRIIECENCHGPALEHPDDPEKLPIDKSRGLCLRCHAKLPYPTSLRSEIKGIDPQGHHPEGACASCHNPHHPNLEDRK